MNFVDTNEKCLPITRNLFMYVGNNSIQRRITCQPSANGVRNQYRLSLTRNFHELPEVD